MFMHPNWEHLVLVVPMCCKFALLFSQTCLEADNSSQIFSLIELKQ